MPTAPAGLAESDMVAVDPEEDNEEDYLVLNKVRPGRRTRDEEDRVEPTAETLHGSPHQTLIDEGTKLLEELTQSLESNPT